MQFDLSRSNMIKSIISTLILFCLVLAVKGRLVSPFVIHDCGLNLLFTLSTNTPAIEDTVRCALIDTIQGANYTWYKDGVEVGNGIELSIEVMDYYNHVVQVEACLDTCCVLSSPRFFSAGACSTGKEANHWLFSRNGIHLDWTSGDPEERENSSMSSDEPTGIAVGSDGQLLFYSNGRQIYNRNHELMLGGASINGDLSSTHSFALQLPGFDSLWYLFYPQGMNSSDTYRDTTTKLYYAIVDVEANGGNGEVLAKDIVLLQPTTEKVAAVKHCNGQDWWVVGHEAGSNRFFSWLLSGEGLSEPIVSAQGESRPIFYSTKAGELNFSSNGTKAAMITGPNVGLNNGPLLELFNFDNSTGMFNNPMRLKEGMVEDFYYGLEFSPNNSYLYYVEYELEVGYSLSVCQFDVSMDNANDILTSEIIVYQTDNPYEDYGALLTAPDGKIYGANLFDSSFCVIHNPNEKGLLCNFDPYGLELHSGRCILGLPTFPAGIHTPEKPWLSGPTIICDTTEEVLYQVLGNCVYQYYDWSTSSNLDILRSQGDSIWLQPNLAGSGHLIVTKQTMCRSTTDTFHIDILGCIDSTCRLSIDQIQIDSVICSDEEISIRCVTNADTVFYVDENEIRVPIPPIASINASSFNSPLDTLELIFKSKFCDSTISFPMHKKLTPSYSLLSIDSFICSGNDASIHFESSADIISFENESGDVLAENPSFPFTFDEIYSDAQVIVSFIDSTSQCTTEFTWNIQVDQLNIPKIDSFYICHGDSFFVHDSFWVYESMEMPSMKIIRTAGCDSAYGVFVQTYPLMVHSLEVDTACYSSTGSVRVNSSGGTGSINYRWSTNDEGSEIINVEPGMYWSIVSDDNCSDSVQVVLPQYDSIQYTIRIGNQSCIQNKDGFIQIESDERLLVSLDDVSYSENLELDSLDAGSYMLYIKGQHECVIQEYVIVEPGYNSNYSIELSDETCFNEADGEIEISNTTSFLSSINGSTFNPITVYSELESGSYSIFLSDTNFACIDTLNVDIQSGPELTVNFPFDTFEILEDQTILDADMYIAGNSDSLLWFSTTGTVCSNCSEINLSSVSQGYYTLQVFDDGCVTQDSFYLIRTSQSIYIPNAFRPTSDLNPKFRIYSATGDVQVRSMKIFNRWGGLVYSCAGVEADCQWDGSIKGKTAESGVYLYEIILLTTDMKKTERYRGELTLLK